MVRLAEIVDVYECEICGNKGKYDEAMECEAQGKPPKVLPRGTVFVGTPKDECLKVHGKYWFVIGNKVHVWSNGHLNMYNGVAKHHSEMIIIPDRDGKTLVQSTPSVEDVRRLTPSELEELWKQDRSFRLEYERITGEFL